MQPAQKNRLVGAAVLIALLIIIVPFFFPSEPAQRGPQDLDLFIPPAPEAALESRTIELIPALPTSQDTPAASGMNDTSSPNAASTTPPTVDNDSAQNAAKAEAEAAAVARANAEKQRQAEQAAAEKQRAEDARKQQAQRQAAAKGDYTVSLGAYGNRANADKLKAVAEKLGYPVRLEAAGNATRVIAGPFATESAAAAAQKKLKANLTSASVGSVRKAGAATTAPAAKPAAASSKKTDGSAASGAWSVQVISYSRQDSANAFKQELEQAGFGAFIVKGAVNGSNIWRVRTGPYGSKQAATQAQQKLKSKYADLDTRVVGN